MTQTVTVSQRQLDEYATRLGQAEDRVAVLERELAAAHELIRAKDAALLAAQVDVQAALDLSLVA